VLISVEGREKCSREYKIVSLLDPNNDVDVAELKMKIKNLYEQQRTNSLTVNLIS
jgi:hypothetical protein